MSIPEDPEEMFRQMVPEVSRRLADRSLALAAEYVRCMDARDALATSSDDPAVQTVIDVADAMRDVVAGNQGDRLTTDQLETILRATGYGMPPETLN